MKCSREALLLYAVTDRSWLKEATLFEQVEEVLKGGATLIQLREKQLDEEVFLKEAREIKALCKKYEAPFVINDNVDIALAIDADGVHVGQNDMEAGDVRDKLGENKMIGVSAQTVEQALLAQANGADYLGVGAVFPTGTKTDAVEVDRETLKAICEAVDIPVIAIGGISAENVGELAGNGICGIAAISALFAQPDIEAATRNLKILDSMPIWEDLGERYLAGFGIKAEAGLTEKLNIMSTRQAADYLIERYGLGISIPQAMEGINHMLYEFYSRQAPLKAGVPDCLEVLKRKGIPMVIATSSDRVNVEAAFRRLDILPYFQEILTCSELRTDKTEAEIFIAAAGRMNAEPKHTIVFEDAPHALETVKEAGFLTVAVYDSSVKVPEEEVRKTADYYLKTFEKFGQIIAGKEEKK